jgi:hypothetical protein
VGGHLALVHRASVSPPVPAAAPVEAVLDLEGAAETCTISEAVPPVWDLDALYLRHPDEGSDSRIPTTGHLHAPGDEVA